MTINDVIREHESMGSTVVRLGAVRLPEGYAVMWNCDGTHAYWVCEDGRQSVEHWDKWAVVRGIINDRERRLGEGGTSG